MNKLCAPAQGLVDVENHQSVLRSSDIVRVVFASNRNFLLRIQRIIGDEFRGCSRNGRDALGE